ncbi:MAG: SPASM domain-containing protein [Peptococcaceae bacterium]|nr:SPASM domain-containing protein [Peptococcaceae bacterium]
MPLDLKNYAIDSHVHTYRQGGFNIAYDVNSGSLHLLDDMTFAYIGEWAAYQKAFPRSLEHPEEMLAATGRQLTEQAKAEILGELAGLQKRQLLFAKPVSEEAHAKAVKAQALGAGTGAAALKRIKAICLHVAHDCNLRCGYCFAGTGHFGGDRGLMSLEVGKKALDFVFAAGGGRPHCEVDFFGGEPLLNWPVVRDLVLYGRELERQTGRTVKFTMTTNAVLFTEEVQDFVEKEHISMVFSLDGRPEIHDRMRPFADRSGSYEVIADRVSDWMRRHRKASRYATGTYAYVRGTYTRHNLDFDRDVMHLAGLGIQRISLEPVVAPPGKDCAYALGHEHVEALEASYDRLGEEARQGKFAFFHFNAGLAGVCLPKRLSGCGAGSEYLAVSPEGDLYPCHQFVGQEAFRMGSLDGGLTDSLTGGLTGGLSDSLSCAWECVLENAAVLTEQFRRANVYGKATCRECWARFSCSGGCHAANVTHGGSLYDVYELGCVLQKKRLEVAYYLRICETMDSDSPETLMQSI